MGCTNSCYNKNNDDLDTSGPLHFDNTLAEHGPNAPYLDKLKYTTTAYVVSVYDGDTFTIATYTTIPTQNNKTKQNKKQSDEQKLVTRVKCRINGIDTPEMRPPKNQQNREKEIAKAKEAKQFVEALLLNKYVRMNVEGLDKYGRLLVQVFCPDTGCDVATMLLDKKHGYKYDGGTKQKFESN